MSNIDWNEFKEELRRERRRKYVPTMPPKEKLYYVKSLEKEERDKIVEMSTQFFKEKYISRPGWKLYYNDQRVDVTTYIASAFMAMFDKLITDKAIKGKKILTENYDYINQDIEDKLADKIKDYFDEMIKKHIEIEVKKRETDIREEERVKAEAEAPNRPKKIVYVDVEKEVIKEKNSDTI